MIGIILLILLIFLLLLTWIEYQKDKKKHSGGFPYSRKKRMTLEDY